MTDEPPASNPGPDSPRAEIPGMPNRPEGSLLGEGVGAQPYASTERDAREAPHGILLRSSDPAFVPLQNSEPRHTLHLSLPHNDGVSADPSVGHPAVGLQSFGQSGRQGENGASFRFAPEPRFPKDGGVFIDKALRERVESDITVFLAAFDAALTHDTPESRTGLREATDRLLRSGARTRIELERLEARMPLPSRNGKSAPWRI